MTHEEIIKEIKELPLNGQLMVLDAISQSVQEEARPPKSRVSVVDQLWGIAKPDRPLPSDEELKEDYIRYLTEKYS
jgi:hypothetical protein